MPVKVRFLYEVRPDVLPELMAEAVDEGLKAALLFWQETFRPIHFTTEANRRYGYQPRSGDDEAPRLVFHRVDKSGRSYDKTISNPHYSWAKRRRVRHNQPLVWSGASKAASSAVRIEASQGKGKLAFVAMPSYFFKYLKAGTYYKQRADGSSSPFTLKHDQPKKYQELVIVTEEEAQAMTAVAEKMITEVIERARQPAEV